MKKKACLTSSLITTVLFAGINANAGINFEALYGGRSSQTVEAPEYCALNSVDKELGREAITDELKLRLTRVTDTTHRTNGFAFKTKKDEEINVTIKGENQIVFHFDKPYVMEKGAPSVELDMIDPKLGTCRMVRKESSVTQQKVTFEKPFATGTGGSTFKYYAGKEEAFMPSGSRLQSPNFDPSNLHVKLTFSHINGSFYPANLECIIKLMPNDEYNQILQRDLEHAVNENIRNFFGESSPFKQKCENDISDITVDATPAMRTSTPSAVN